MTAAELQHGTTGPADRMQNSDRRNSNASTPSMASSVRGRLLRHIRVLVAVRARPLNAKELEQRDREVWRCNGSRIEELDDDGTTPTRGGRFYEYDKVFDPHASTKEIFELQCQSVTQNVLEGYNGTIFAYGQTSSGKTFTLTENSRSNPGIAIQAMEHIFKKAASSSHNEYEIHVSYMEIHNETIADLLQKKSSKKNGGKQLRITEDKKYGPVVQDITEEHATSQADCLNIYHEGEKNRTIASTNMNERSSRAHTIFRLRIQSRTTSSSKAEDSGPEAMHMVARDFMTFEGEIQADRASLFIVDREAEELYTTAGELTLRFPMSEGIAGSVAATGNKENIREAYDDPRFNRAVDKSTGYTTRSILCVPFFDSQGRVLGVVQFINKMTKTGEVDPRGFDIEDENQVQELCQSIGPRVLEAKMAAQVASFSWFNIVDLAGSERIKKANSTGATLKEAAFINTSLMTLGTVVSQLSENKTQHISYRNSKLTHLLSTSLGGNANTSLICAISPAASNRSETHSTLQFASRAIQIVNNAKKNVQIDLNSLLKTYQSEVHKLREELLQANAQLGILADLPTEPVTQLRRPASPLTGPVTPRSTSEGELGQIFGLAGSTPEDQLTYFSKKLARTMHQERADAFLQDIAEALRLAREANDAVSLNSDDESVKFEADIAGVRRPFATVRLLKTGRHELTGTESVAILQSWSTNEMKAKLEKIRASPSFLEALVKALIHHGFTATCKSVEDESAASGSPPTTSNLPNGSATDFDSPSRGAAVHGGAGLPAAPATVEPTCIQPEAFSAREYNMSVPCNPVRLTQPLDAPAGHWPLSPRTQALSSGLGNTRQQSPQSAPTLQAYESLSSFCTLSEACSSPLSNRISRMNMRHTLPADPCAQHLRSASPSELGQSQPSIIYQQRSTIGAISHSLPQQTLNSACPSAFASVQVPPALVGTAPQAVAPFSVPVSQLSAASNSRASSPLPSPDVPGRLGVVTPLEFARAQTGRSSSPPSHRASLNGHRTPVPMLSAKARSATSLHQVVFEGRITRCRNHKSNTRFCHCPSCTAERLSPRSTRPLPGMPGDVSTRPA